MTEEPDTHAISAQAHLHHAYFLGLQLMVATRKGPEVMGDWMFRLFRRQHLDKFLSSFDKLGLSHLPDAVACAKYHVLSNGIGGVPVEYMPESERKAWVRFRYPRWMYHGPTICGVPVEVSRGFLRGWYAHNGVSLQNPRLGYVCVSEDMTGEFGLCGYFYEYDHDLAPHERLRFAKDELPPPFDPAQQPEPPADQWDEVRLAKANRNYAMDYIRNGLCELTQVIGSDQTRELGSLAAGLIGLQYFAETSEMIGVGEEETNSAAHYLVRMFAGMGDAASADLEGKETVVVQAGLRVLRGLKDEERDIVLTCWAGLWSGAMRARRSLKGLSWEDHGDSVTWRISEFSR